MSDTVKGLVVKGYGQGRALGYPTANLELTPGSSRPAPGVYLATINGLEGAPYFGLLVSGVHREAGGNPRVEVYIIDWSKDIYGRNLEVQVGKKIRELIFTDDLIELKQIIAQDVKTARSFFDL